MTFGEQLCKLRLYRGLTQDDLAKATGIVYETISRYERGRCTPPLKQFKRICNALDVSYGRFLDEVDFDGQGC